MPCRLSPLILASLALLAGTAARAETRHGQTVVVEVAELIERNLYVSGGAVSVHGRIKGDLLVTGDTVTIDGTVDGDVLVVARDVTINADVLGDVRIAAASATIGGRIEGDIAATGAVLALTARTRGDVHVFGADVVVTGRVGGNLLAASRSLTLDAEVDGDVMADGGALRVGDKAIVHGELRSNTGIDLAPSAQIVGLVTTTPRASRASTVADALRLFVGLALLGAFWRGLSQRRTTRAVEIVRDRPMAAFVAGLATLVAVPLVLVAIFAIGMFTGGWWVAVLGIVLFAVAAASTLPLMAAVAGRLWTTRAPLPVDPDALEDPDFVAPRVPEPTAARGVGAYLLSVALLVVILSLPVVGVVVGSVAVVFGLGAMLLTLTGIKTIGPTIAAVPTT